MTIAEDTHQVANAFAPAIEVLWKATGGPICEFIIFLWACWLKKLGDEVLGRLVVAAVESAVPTVSTIAVGFLILVGIGVAAMLVVGLLIFARQ